MSIYDEEFDWEDEENDYDWEDEDEDDYYPDFQADIYEAFLWAWKLVNDYEHWVVLDTETTGLEANDEIIDLAIISRHGSTMFDSLIKPTCPVSEGARAVHHISDEMLADAPTFPEVYPRIKEILTDKLVIIYNKNFDLPKLKHCCEIHNLELPKFDSKCAMLWYAQYYNSWHDYWQNYTWQKLPNSDRRKHRAKSDAYACWKLIYKMAQTLSDRVKLKPQLFPKKQLFIKWKNWLKFEFSISKDQNFYNPKAALRIKKPIFEFKDQNVTNRARY